MKSWSVRCAVAVFVLALGGCPDLHDDLGPEGDLTPVEDAGRTVDPIEAKDDSSVAKRDATVVAEPKDAAPAVKDASAEDAGDHDAGSEVDASSSDAGSEPSDAGSEPTVGSFASVYALIVESCVGCHGAGKTLDLSSPELALAGLVGVEAKYAACVSDGGVTPVRVVAGEPESSLLIAKLEGTQSCGKQMPPKALLEAEKIKVFRAWVAAGASAQ